MSEIKIRAQKCLDVERDEPCIFLMTLSECEEPFFTKESWWLAPNTAPIVSERGVD